MFNHIKFLHNVILDICFLNRGVCMSELGSRIKKIRKEKKMTLAELAGERLSKGMLSLIENGKAQPSMESLHYIAEQLNVEVSLLLNDSKIEEVRALLLEVEEEYSNIRKKSLNLSGNPDIVQILEKIESVQDHLFGNNYEEIRLLDLKIRLTLFINENEFHSEEMYKVIDLYEKIHAYSRMVNCYTFLSTYAFTQKDYIIALQFMQQAETRIEPFVHLVDHLSKLDMHYLLTVLYAAVDNVSKTEKHLKIALEISQSNKIYYRLDDFYRFMLVQSMGRHDLEKSEYYITKLKLHAEFTEDFISQYTTLCCEAFYSNLIEKDYQKTIRIAKKAKEFILQHSEVLTYLLDYIVAEEIYALWALGLYNEAIDKSQNFKVSTTVHHPYDIATMYKCFAVRALCYEELGDKEAAKRDILYASNGVNGFPKTIDKSFIDEAYKKIIY